MAGRKRRPAEQQSSQLGAFIEAQLQKRGWTAAHLAAEVGMSEGSLSDLLNGRTVTPKVTNLIAIAEALGETKAEAQRYFARLVEATTGFELGVAPSASDGDAATIPLGVRLLLEETSWAEEALEQLNALPMGTRETVLGYLEYMVQRARSTEQDAPKLRSAEE